MHESELSLDGAEAKAHMPLRPPGEGNSSLSTKVLLVYPDFIESRGGTHLRGSYSEGLASISAVLKQAGHEVSLYHLNSPPAKEKYIQTVQNRSPDIVGFTAWTAVYPYIRDFLRWTREAGDYFTVCGGYHATLAPEEVIREEGADAVCIGEGEYPMLDLCNLFRHRDEEFYSLPSFWFRRGEEIIRNPVRPYPENLDELPLPDFALFDYENFLTSRVQTALVMLSRGCVFNCTYCANPQLREIYPNRSNYARFKSPRHSVEYLRAILDRYPFIRYFNFMDSILPLKRAWFMEFIELYRREIGLPFNCRLRADLMDEEIVAKLKEAGCYMGHLGIESGDEEMRSRYLSRRMTDRQIIDAMGWLRRYGIPTLTYNIVGLPHEDLRRALKTIKLNARAGAKRMIVSIFFPYPSTRLAEMAREAGYIGDTVDYRGQVVLDQPAFSRYQVLFAHRFFRAFAALYRFAFSLPRPLAAPAERFIDWLFCTRLLPRRPLVALYNAWAWLLNVAKRGFMRVAPRPYLAVRNALIRLRSGRAASAGGT